MSEREKEEKRNKYVSRLLFPLVSYGTHTYVRTRKIIFQIEKERKERRKKNNERRNLSVNSSIGLDDIQRKILLLSLLFLLYLCVTLNFVILIGNARS